MYEFWYDYVKPKYGEKAKLCYMDTANFIAHGKTDDIYEAIAEDVEARFETSDFELDRHYQKEKGKKVIGLIKDKLSGKILTDFVRLSAKTYSCLKDTNYEEEKATGTKKCVIKRKRD